MDHVVMFSGGVGSWMAAKRVAAKYGTDNLTLLFTDTKMEDEDLYRFLHEAAANVGGRLEIIADGRNPWQVFHDVRWIGNSRRAPCSHVLKQVPARKWLEEHYSPDEVTVYLGIDWTEIHRWERAREHYKPYRCEAPLCEPPYIDKPDMLRHLEEEGIEPPRLYRMGFPHNNCGGACVRAGVAQWLHLLKLMPERYKWHEEQEEAMRQYLGKDVSILRYTRNGVTRPLTLRELRENTPVQLDLFDWGGCGCFLDYDDDEAPAECQSVCGL